MEKCGHSCTIDVDVCMDIGPVECELEKGHSGSHRMVEKTDAWEFVDKTRLFSGDATITYEWTDLAEDGPLEHRNAV